MKIPPVAHPYVLDQHGNRRYRFLTSGGVQVVGTVYPAHLERVAQFREHWDAVRMLASDAVRVEESPKPLQLRRAR